MKLYGIANCTTVKRARAWLVEQGVECDFHDFKKMGVPANALHTWIDAIGWQVLLNRQGTTWRKLAPVRQQAVVDAGAAALLMQEMPSVIRRPVVEWDDGLITLGFDPADWISRI